MPLFNGDPVVDIYVSAAGSDNDNGLSPTTPKLTIAAAVTLAGLYAIPANLHLRSGDVFRGAANKLAATVAGMTIDTYGGTAQARIDGGINIVGNTFTSIGSNRFTTTYKSTSDRSIPTTLSYSGATRTLKVASQAAVTGPGMWFASNSGTTVTVTVYSTSTPGAQYTSIMLDWQTCVRVTAARVTINNIMAINGYVGFHYVGSVNAQGSSQYAFQNSGDGFRFDTGAHGCVHWSPTARENGIPPDEGPEGFRVGSGSATSIDVWGGQLYNPVAINNGEDGFLGGITPGGAWRIFNANFTANHENSVDIKGGSFEFYGGIFDQRGTFTTLSPVTLHQNAPNAQFYDMRIYGRDQLPLSAQGGIGFDQGATGTIVRCEIWCGASSGILCQPASGGITVLATTVWKQAVGSTISPIRFQNDATHPATHVLKHVTSAGNAPGGVPLSMVCLQGDAAGVSGSSINCLWNNPTTVATSRACVVMTGAVVWTSTNDLYYKGETTEVARATSKLSATQVAAGVTNGPLTISGAVVANPQLDDINVGDLRPHAGGPADNAGSTAANVFADRDNVGFGVPPDIGALRAA